MFMTESRSFITLTRNIVSCGDIFWKTTLWIEDLPDLSVNHSRGSKQKQGRRRRDREGGRQRKGGVRSAR